MAWKRTAIRLGRIQRCRRRDNGSQSHPQRTARRCKYRRSIGWVSRQARAVPFRACDCRAARAPAISDAKSLQVEQKKLARRFSIASNMLIFGQYIVGGVLASSFVQQWMSSQIVGMFGVIVLLASLIKQHYRPEAAAQLASQRAARLQVLIREVGRDGDHCRHDSGCYGCCTVGCLDQKGVRGLIRH